MAHDRRCPRCGKPLAPDVKAGACPACLLRAGLEIGSAAAPLDAPNGDRMAIGFESNSPGHVLETLARSIGSIPRVLLPDTAIDDQGVAVIKPSSDEIPAPAERGPRYQLFGEIARGGMGAVLKGRDPDLGRDLAVKVLLEGHRDKPDLLRRFVEEAQIGGQLQHPGIVPVYELGTFADSRPYFTMKLVKGRTLGALLHERPGPQADLPRFLGIFEQVCQTMAYAHARGVIHRDLKPSNIMVGSFGEVQVMDWGLAKVLKEGGIADEPPAPDTPEPAVSAIRTVRSGSGVDDSQAGSILGTPAYMAPEQAGGDVEHVDRRADVFGLGSILCEVLTGQPAYTGRTQAEVMRRAVRGDTGEAMSRLDGCGAEAELVGLAKDCLAAEVEDRPRDAGIVAGRVSAYLAGVQERVRQAELARARADARAQEERKRRKLALALAATVVALMAAGGGGAAVYLRQREAEAARLAVSLRDVEVLRDQARADPMGDPERWRAAVAAAERAADLLGPMADARSRGRVRDLLEDIRRAAHGAESDARLLRAAVDIRSAEADDPDGSASDAAYAAAFRDAGLDVDAMGADAAGAQIRARPPGVATALAAALDDWAGQRRNARPGDMEGWRRPIDVARVVDPDPTRDRLRALWARVDREARREPLLELAKQADPRGWPPASLLLLAVALYDADERDAAVGLLRRAVAHHPGDVWLNYRLASWLEAMTPPRSSGRRWMPCWRRPGILVLSAPIVARGDAVGVNLLRERFSDWLAEDRPGECADFLARLEKHVGRRIDGDAWPIEDREYPRIGSYTTDEIFRLCLQFVAVGDFEEDLDEEDDVELEALKEFRAALEPGSIKIPYASHFLETGDSDTIFIPLLFARPFAYDDRFVASLPGGVKALEAFAKGLGFELLTEAGPEPSAEDGRWMPVATAKNVARILHGFFTEKPDACVALS